jgi:hypothetical protein
MRRSYPGGECERRIAHRCVASEPAERRTRQGPRDRRCRARCRHVYAHCRASEEAARNQGRQIRQRLVLAIASRPTRRAGNTSDRGRTRSYRDNSGTTSGCSRAFRACRSSALAASLGAKPLRPNRALAAILSPTIARARRGISSECDRLYLPPLRWGSWAAPGMVGLLLPFFSGDISGNWAPIHAGALCGCIGSVSIVAR